MPYTKIVWIKLCLSLVTEDDRFLYQLNESQQLLYVKMLMMAGLTNNKISKRPKFICDRINYHHGEECFLKDISRIREVFPKLEENSDFYILKDFEKLHNQVGFKLGYPIPEKRISYFKKKDILFPSQIKNKNKNKKKLLSPQEFISSLKTNDVYKHINIDNELLKMDTWLAQHPGRKKTPRFVLNWLNKIEAPIGAGGTQWKKP